uniref:Carbohydrate kinase FGGY C-terminal domain-containing protein n=1 Tax=Timema monikensis TaxID=170555 RepID=A0A7R9HJY9_9NEOP|nr:unnamed protein product [Timema monikensis]
MTWFLRGESSCFCIPMDRFQERLMKVVLLVVVPKFAVLEVWGNLGGNDARDSSDTEGLIVWILDWCRKRLVLLRGRCLEGSYCGRPRDLRVRGWRILKGLAGSLDRGSETIVAPVAVDGAFPFCWAAGDSVLMACTSRHDVSDHAHVKNCEPLINTHLAVKTFLVRLRRAHWITSRRFCLPKDHKKKRSNTPPRVDGGVSHNDFVCQLLADLIEIKVERSTSTEMSVLGVGFLAGLYSGVWKSKEELCQLRKPLALPSASLKPILWDSGWEGERRGGASQPTKVSFHANKNRRITDCASYRTGLAEKSYFWKYQFSRERLDIPTERPPPVDVILPTFEDRSVSCCQYNEPSSSLSQFYKPELLLLSLSSSPFILMRLSLTSH